MKYRCNRCHAEMKGSTAYDGACACGGLIEACENPESIIDATHGFVVPGKDQLIDVVRPSTGKSWFLGETLDEMRVRYPGVEIVSIADWCRAKAVRQDAPVTWAETTEEHYWEMLECVPPACMMGGGFMVGEPWDHHAITGQPRFAAYLERHGKFLESSRPMQRAEFTAFIAEERRIA